MEIYSLLEFIHSCQVLLEKNPTEWERKVVLLLLQIVTALKQLQAKGIEEACLDSIKIISKLMSDDSPRLIIMENEASGQLDSYNEKKVVSLCRCAASVIQIVLGNPLSVLKDTVLCPPLVPSPHAFSTLVNILREERANSLTKVT